MTFSEVFWLILYTFFLFAYLMILFQIIADLFRDKELSGWAKALWVLFLVFFPFLGALVYLIARGDGMANRQMEDLAQAKEDTDNYIRQVAGSPTSQIADAKKLLDDGAITPEEYEALKAKALA